MWYSNKMEKVGESRNRKKKEKVGEVRKEEEIGDVGRTGQDRTG